MYAYVLIFVICEISKMVHSGFLFVNMLSIIYDYTNFARKLI